MEWRVNCWLKKTPPAEFALFNAPSRTEKSRKVERFQTAGVQWPWILPIPVMHKHPHLE